MDGLAKIKNAIHLAWKPSDRRSPWEWCEEHIVVDKTSPFPGRWRSSTSPWVKELMEVFADNRVTDIAVMCSAQSAKTQTIMNLVCWAISEDAGPMMWVTAAQDEAATFCRTRLWPTLMRCKPVAMQLPTNTREIRSLEINFPSMPFVVTGSNSPSKLQSKPIRWLLLDEARNYPAGALDMVLKRTRAYWNARRVIISTPCTEKDAVHTAFMSGDQRKWFWPCMGCGEYNQLLFPNMKWDTNEKTKPSEKWDFEELAKTIRWACPKCGHEHFDIPKVRKHICSEGIWKKENPLAPRNRVSFHWNAMLPTWVSWRSVVEEFISSYKALKWGDHLPHKTFINETLGESWEDRFGDTEKKDHLIARMSDYDPAEKWELEKRRLMTIDVQQDHMFYVVRAWGAGGISRLITYGKAFNFDEIKHKITEYSVQDENVAIDSGYSTATIYKAIVESGYKWKALKGDQGKYYVNPKGLRSIWTKSAVDPFMGTRTQGITRPIQLFIFSSSSTKDMLSLFIRGLTSEWSIPRGVSEDYLDQMTAEKRQEFTDPKGRVSYEWVRMRKANHYWDCEQMQLVGAVATGMVGDVGFIAPRKETPKAESPLSTPFFGSHPTSRRLPAVG